MFFLGAMFNVPLPKAVWNNVVLPYVPQLELEVKLIRILQSQCTWDLTVSQCMRWKCRDPVVFELYYIEWAAQVEMCVKILKRGRLDYVYCGRLDVHFLREALDVPELCACLWPKLREALPGLIETFFPSEC